MDAKNAIKGSLSHVKEQDLHLWCKPLVYYKQHFLDVEDIRFFLEYTGVTPRTQTIMAVLDALVANKEFEVTKYQFILITFGGEHILKLILMSRDTMTCHGILIDADKFLLLRGGVVE